MAVEGVAENRHLQIPIEAALVQQTLHYNPLNWPFF